MSGATWATGVGVLRSLVSGVAGGFGVDVARGLRSEFSLGFSVGLPAAAVGATATAVGADAAPAGADVAAEAAVGLGAGGTDEQAASSSARTQSSPEARERCSTGAPLVVGIAWETASLARACHNGRARSIWPDALWSLTNRATGRRCSAGAVT